MRLIPDLDVEGEMRIKLETKEEEKIIELLKKKLIDENEGGVYSLEEENMESCISLVNREAVENMILGLLTYNANGILERVDGRLDRV